ncbi:MAG: aldehyde dehydrogenase family protein [Deltaproteobacteria bacterium]|nr:aldehyde dehydrogenase family protein [Deltaproteobacteria bacterium]
MDQARGDFIDNQWVLPEGGAVLRSTSPSSGEPVFETLTDPGHAAHAVAAAKRALPAWSRLDPSERVTALRRFARELTSRVESLAQAIAQEVGKPIREARAEANGLIGRVDAVADQHLAQVQSWSPAGVDGECRYHPLGVIAVMGPYNYPLHLVHAHVIPALATGNTVVVKPSERAPLAAQRYAEAWAHAGLPPVLQMIQGGADVGRALVATPGIHGVALTGSWRAGRAIQEALLDRPEVLAALEMGGQNMAIVLPDADLDQALEGVLLGAFLTAGQRCTCTSRVLVAKEIADQFIPRLVAGARALSVGDPFGDAFMGPMASALDRERVDALCAAGRAAGAEVLLAPTPDGPGAYRGPSIHLIAPDHDSDYTREEVFGPDLAVTVVDDLDAALAVVNASAYGFSTSVFTARKAAFEQVYRETRVGCVNWNRSTNRASGAMPFGGVGRSGNYRPAGSDAVRYTTYPVQVQWNRPGVLENDPHVRRALAESDPVDALEIVHRLEEACEPYGLYPDVDPKGSLRLGRAQLDRGVNLAEPLRAELIARGVAADLDEGGVRVTFGAGVEAARGVAQTLADALHAIRWRHPTRFLGRRPAGSHVPAGDALALPRSDAFMKRLVAGGFVPDDKKPPILDLYRSAGGYLASVDDDPLVIFDAASQIATHAGGLNPPAVLRALWAGRFGATPIDGGDPRETSPALGELEATLRKAAGHHFPFVALSNSGGEANELALATCAQHRPGRRGVIAFRGSFHGRTLLALHQTWNPEKRLRFEIQGFQARWVDLASCGTPREPAPEPPGWIDAWSARRPAGEPRFDADGDELLAAELDALDAVERYLEDDQAAACIIEPMQSEGGENYASPRFFRALRALTTAYGVPLVMDEVQTGFHLGGPFFWHTLFDLPSPPDLITCAKKAQVGATLSHWPIPFRAETHPTSAIRGTVYAELLAAADPAELFADVDERLAALAKAHPETVLRPRHTGYAFGFDLPSPAALAHIVNQRLWRGWMVYGAGSQALRFRLHPELGPVAVEALFQRLHESLLDLEADAPTAWRAGASEHLADHAVTWPIVPAKLPPGHTLLKVGRAEWPKVRGAYEALQRVTYEPARQDDFERFTALMDDPDAVCLLVVQGSELPPRGKLVGACIAFPMEHFRNTDGPRQDENLGAGNTLYAADTTVHAEHRGSGLGRVLKEAQIAWAMQHRRRDGSLRYHFVVGRNRVGLTARMRWLNGQFGAVRVQRYLGQYGDPSGAADYYRINLLSPRLPPGARLRPQPPRVLDLDPGLERRLGDVRAEGEGAAELVEGFHAGRMNGAVVNKLSLCNFVTPGVVRAHEALRASAPKGLAHLVAASGRAEMLDKTLRAFKYHRGDAQVVISLGPVHAGMSTAAARAVSLPANHADNWFGWPSLSDPAHEPERCLAELKKELATRGGASVLAVVAEGVYEETGGAPTDGFWGALGAVLDEHDVPLLLIENTTAGYRGGRGMWRADTLPHPADAVLWFPGGQLGLGFVSDRYHVAEKLTLISTWAGDEVSLVRLLWELRVLRRLPVAARAAELAAALEPLGGAVSGDGLYRVVTTPNAARIHRQLADRGIAVGLLDEQRLRFAPALNVSREELERLAAAAREVKP